MQSLISVPKGTSRRARRRSAACPRTHVVESLESRMLLSAVDASLAAATMLRSVAHPAIVTSGLSVGANPAGNKAEHQTTLRPNSTFAVGGKPTVTLTAPSGLTAALQGSIAVKLSWADDGSASGYYVMRSTSGGRFSTIATLGSVAPSSYLDSAITLGKTYTYEVEAYGGGRTSSPSNTASVTVPTTPVPPAPPSGLGASVTGSWVSLNWTDNDSSATGYTVLRSTDGVNYASIAQLTSASASGYIDTSVLAGQAYDYEVEAVNAVGSSSASNVASVSVPTAPPIDGVAVSLRYGDELVITASGSNDSVSISESGSSLDITADGQSSTDAIPLAGVFVYTRGGNDAVSIDPSVNIRTTVETIDGAPTAIESGGSNVSAWIDSTDTFTGSGAVHRVSNFAGGVSKGAGASLPDPSDSGSVVQVNLSLFSSGPVEDDVNQGETGDCYFLASLSAFANEKPTVLTEAAVDMGDGTYVVQFHSGSTLSYVRVSNDFSTGKFGGFEYAHPGVNNTIWAMVMEKAFAYFRTGANTYASIGFGSMTEAYSDLGVSSSNFIPSSYSASSFYSMVSADLANGEAVTFGTPSTSPNLVGDHAYTLVSVYTDSNGVMEFVVRNPWGFAGDSLEDAQGYATLTFAQVTANFSSGTQAIG